MQSWSLFTASASEAERLGHRWVGPEHGLLAILRGDPTDVARQTLNDAGLDADRFERWCVDGLWSDRSPRIDPDHSSVSPNPAWYRAEGKAKGFANFAGHHDVRAVDLLLALLWDSSLWLWVLASAPEVTREAIVDRLKREGVTLPAASLPDLHRQWRNPTRIDFPISALGDVVRILVERYPAGSGLEWIFKHDGAERAWAVAEEGIDLRAIVDEACAERGGG